MMCTNLGQHYHIHNHIAKPPRPNPFVKPAFKNSAQRLCVAMQNLVHGPDLIYTRSKLHTRHGCPFLHFLLRRRHLWLPQACSLQGIGVGLGAGEYEGALLADDARLLQQDTLGPCLRALHGQAK